MSTRKTRNMKAQGTFIGFVVLTINQVAAGV